MLNGNLNIHNGVMLVLWIVLFIIGIVLAFITKRFFGIPAILVIGSIVVVLCTIINNATAEKKIQLSNTTLNQISEIDWKDEENLISIGFDKKKNVFCFRDIETVRVKKSESIPTNVQKYENFRYKFSETGYGIFDLQQIWDNEGFVTRSYHIYVGDLEISMYEHATEDSPYLFEEMISKIFKRQGD